MGKFAISCPKCGKYVMAHNGIRGMIENTVNCTCGNVIDVKAERMAATVCRQCGNTVVYDQGSNRKRKCPVCGTEIALGSDIHMVSFRCPECNIELEAREGTAKYTCPVCECEINVTKEVEKKRLSDSGLISNILYEGDNNTLVFKHPIEDFRNGSQLTVHSSQEAIFFRDGEALDILKAGRYTLETQNLPIMDRVYKIPTDGTPFHAEVYFVNITTQMGVKWGTPDKVTFIDPLTSVPLSIGARGVLNYKVANSKKLLIKLVGTTDNLRREDILGDGQSYAKDYFRPLIQTSISSNLANAIQENKIDILQIDQQRLSLSKTLLELVAPSFADYGLEITELLIEGIVLPVRGEIGYDALQTIIKLREKDLKKREIQTDAELEKAKLNAQKDLDIQKQQNQAETEEARRLREAQEIKTQTQRDEYERMKKVADAATDAEAKRFQAQQELDVKERTARIEAEEMRLKGYTQKDVIQGEVLKTFGENPGEGGGAMVRGAFGDAVSAGVGLGIVGTAAGVAKDVINTGVHVGDNISRTIGSLTNGWLCTCGVQNNADNNFCAKCGKPKGFGDSKWVCECGVENTGDFCTSCGKARPLVWDCFKCGKIGNTGEFCPRCGAQKPAMAETWVCPMCGKTVSSNACPDCGCKRHPKKMDVFPDVWTCRNCGKSGIKSKFCPDCGSERPALVPSSWNCKCGQTNITSKFCPECGEEHPAN